MVAATPIDFANWNNTYLNVLQEFNSDSAQQQFFTDIMETVSQLLLEINVLEARIAALEP